MNLLLAGRKSAHMDTLSERINSSADKTDVAADSPKRTILLVDDDGMILLIVGHYLVFAGFHVIASDSPGKALEIAADTRQGIDLLLTDMIMPGMNGLELSKAIAAIRPDIKTLFSSGHDLEGLRQLNVEVSSALFLCKPYDLGVLQTMLIKLLDGDTVPA